MRSPLGVAHARLRHHITWSGMVASCRFFSFYIGMERYSHFILDATELEHVAKMCRRRDSNPHALRRAILSRLRLPFRHSGGRNENGASSTKLPHLERKTRFELATFSLARRRATAAPLPHSTSKLYQRAPTLSRKSQSASTCFNPRQPSARRATISAGALSLRRSPTSRTADSPSSAASARRAKVP